MSRPRDFWSRRKAQVAAEASEETRRADEVRLEARADALAEQSDEDILARFGLPDPDSLVPGDGIAGFMRREIPERLRRRALRSLWRSNPVLACIDGLNDYDDDYSNAVTDMPGVRTAYQVGKGMKAHVEALEAEARRKAGPPEATPDIAASDTDAETNTDDGADQGAAFADARDALGTTRIATEQGATGSVRAPGDDGAATALTDRPEGGQAAVPGKAGNDAGAGSAGGTDAMDTTKVVGDFDKTPGAALYTHEETMPRPRRMRFRFEETT